MESEDRRRELEVAHPIVDESVDARPTAETDPGECRWCFDEATGGKECPYHGETAQRGEVSQGA